MIKVFAVMAVLALSLLIEPNSKAQERPLRHDSGKTIAARQSDYVVAPRGSMPKRKVRVGLYENKPKVFMDENGRPSGIFIEVLDYIAQKEKWELAYAPCTWSECLLALEEGRIDLMPDVAYSMERNRKYDFHDEPVIESWSEVYAHNGAQVKSISDLNGRRLAVLEGSIQQEVLQLMMKGFGFEAPFVPTKSYEEAFRLAAGGAVDAAVSNHFFGNYYFQEYGLVKTPIVFNPASLYFITAKGRNSDMLAAINRNLQAIKSEPNSIYYKALGRWMERPRPPMMVVPRYLFWILGCIGGSLVLTLVVIVLLRQQVRARTRHLVQANELLRESEEKYSALYETSRDGIAFSNMDGNFLQANRAFLDMAGYEIQELKNLNYRQLTPGKWHTTDADILKTQVLPRGYSDEYEKECLRKDGSIFPIAIRIWLMKDAAENPVGMWKLVRNMTDQKMLERQRIMTEKMTAVGMLAAGIAHELNNPMMGIHCFIEYCMKHTQAEDKRYEILDNAKQETQRCMDLVENLLTFSHTGHQADEEYRKESCEVILDRVTKLLSYRIEKDKVRMIKQVPAEMPEIWTRGNGIQQVLLNLTTNALDAVKESGKKEIRFEALAVGDYVQISVSDTGAGISPEHMQRVFDPFYTTKPAGKGTGLGLAVSRSIVSAHKGKITCESEPGQGTTFKVLLPVNQN